MGNQIALLKNPDELIKILLPHLSYTKTLSDAQLIKTTMCSTSNEGYIVAKFFMDGFLNYEQDSQKSQLEFLNEELKKMKNFESQLDLRKNPNILALNPSLINKENQFFLIAQRQYVYLSLLRKSRNKIPKLTLSEKKWLIFQLLCAVWQIHQQEFKHGDIKPENILITSSNQLFLTDLVFYKPAYVEADDLKSYTLYFGELENHNRCYFAPERFCEPDFNKGQRSFDYLNKSMDIFSVGCVIAEIMMDGVPLFDRSRLFSYKRQIYNPKINLKKKIHETGYVELILKMIDVQENNRPTIQESLQILLNQNLLPQSFHKQFYQISSAFIRPQYLFSDMKISLLRKYMDKIWKLCFDDKQLPKFLEPIEREIQLKINQDGIEEHNYQLVPNFEMNLQRQESNLKNTNQINDQKDSAIIIINWIGTFMPTCFYPQTRRCALELLMLIGKQSSLQVKLQIVLPYILKMFDDKQPKVQAKAIQAAVLIFENFITNDDGSENQQLSSMDYRVFSNFIMPQFKNLLEKKQYKDIQIVQLTLSKYLPMLSKIGQRFTELSVASRLQRKYQHQQICSLNKDQINQNQELEHQGEEDEEISFLDPQVYFQENEQNTQKKNNQEQHDHQEAQVNFDQEIDLLRKEFNQINSDYVNSNDVSIKRILFSRIGQQCDFFGSKMTMDSLVPLLLTCANEKEVKIKIDCLKSVISVGIKVGKLAFTQHMLPVYLTFLNESDELVLLQFLRTLSALIKMNLINKSTIFPDYQKSQQESFSIIENLLPFLLHPNCWIREETLNLILNLFDYQNNTIFSKTEVFCLLRQKIQPYLAQRSSIFLLMNGKNSLELLDHLQQPLQRSTFEMYIQQDNKNFDNQNEFKQSKNDTYALQYMKEFLQLMKTQNQKKAYINSGSKNQLQNYKNKQEFFRLYRVVNIQIIENNKQQQNKKNYELIDYQNKYFQPCNFKIQKQYKLSEIDYIMQALNLQPDYQKNTELSNKLLIIQNQSLPLKWSLQIEKIGYQSGSPSEIPQFHPIYSKTTSQKIEQQQDKLQLGQPRLQIEKFRPKGRLITTLHEHQNPVTSVCVSEDQKLFITSSREDGKVKVWSTIDVLRDPTSNSILSLDQNITKCKINKVCSIDNSKLFCVAGTDANLQIYDIDRMQSQSGDQSLNRKGQNDKYQQNIVPLQQITNKNIEHKNEGDILNCINTILPISHQHIISYTSSNGSLFMYDLRCRKPFLKQQEVFQKEKGIISCMSMGQDPYQLLCGSIGGYVSVYDIRYNLVSSQFKHSQKYPINSIATFKPQDKLEFPNQFTNLNLNKTYNKSNFYSPMALVSLGGPKYELSLLNLDSGDIEMLITVIEPSIYSDDNQNQPIGIQIPSFFRESQIRDIYSWPEKSENNQSLYKRLQMQTKSLMNSHQIKLNKNIDEELFKGSKSLYKLLKESSESKNVCRKILIPRRHSSLLQSTQTVDYAITGGNDMRLRYWNLTDPTNSSYFINTPNNDECQYFSSQIAGGILYVREQINVQKNFPIINANMFQENSTVMKQGNKLIIPQSVVEISDDSIYHNILADIIKQKMFQSQDYEGLKNQIGAKNLLGQSIINEISLNQSNRFQIEVANEKVNVLNYNGLSEWQHFNGIHLNEGNSSLVNSSYNDKWSNSKKQNQIQNDANSKIIKNDNFYDSQLKQYRQGDGNQAFDQDKNQQSVKDYVFRESTNVSHSDAILDIEIIEMDLQNQNSQGTTGSSLTNNSTLLVTCGRDSTVKIWQ